MELNLLKGIVLYNLVYLNFKGLKMIQFSDLEDNPLSIIGFYVATKIGNKIIISAYSKLDKKTKELIFDLVEEERSFKIAFGDFEGGIYEVYKVLGAKDIARPSFEEFYFELDVVQIHE